jgi:hypothetical protein
MPVNLTRDALINSTYLQAYHPVRSYILPMKYNASTGNGLPGASQGRSVIRAMCAYSF